MSVSTVYILDYHNRQGVTGEVDHSCEDAKKLVYRVPVYRFPRIDFEVESQNLYGNYWSGERIYQMSVPGSLCFRSPGSELLFEDIKDVCMKDVLVKTPHYDATHEFVVGAFGTNKLRNSLPNFSYVLGGCHIPGENTPLIKDVLYENLDRSITLRDYLGQCNVEEFLNQYLQVIYALDEAYKTIDFTHYDLHHENVRIRVLNEEVSIKYHTENDEEYFHTSLYPCIQGYSYSHFKHNGKDYGVVESKYNIANRSYPMYDAYKLLMYCMAEVKSKNNFEVYNICRRIFEYFNTEDSPKHAVVNQEPVLYYLPPFRRFEDMSLLGLAEYIRSSVLLDFISPIPGAKLYSSEHRIFANATEAVSRVSRLEDILLVNKELPDTEQILVNDETVDIFNVHGRNLADYIKHILSQFKIYTIHGGSVETLNDENFTTIYQRYIYTTIDLFNCIGGYRQHLKFAADANNERVVDLEEVLGPDQELLLEKIKMMLEADMNWVREIGAKGWWANDLAVYIDSLVE